jgi:uncharacterized protein
MNSEAEGAAAPIIVPHRELAPDTLTRLIESFVLREGTEYGAREFSLEEKVAHVLGQLERGEAEIFFDPDSETVDIRRATRRSASARSS